MARRPPSGAIHPSTWKRGLPIRHAARGDFATKVPANTFDAPKITASAVAREGLAIPALIASPWATLKPTFAGVPESVP